MNEQPLTSAEMTVYIKIAIMNLGAIPLQQLKSLAQDSKIDYMHYDTIGILDGANYHQNSKVKKAYAQRAQALYNLAKTLHETSTTLKQGETPSILESIQNPDK